MHRHAIVERGPTMRINPLMFPLMLVGLMTAGCLYTNVKVPLDSNVEETKLGPKVGRATAKSYAYLVAVGDASTAAAAAQGGITTITHLDQENKVYFFGIYSEHTTIAYGY